MHWGECWVRWSPPPSLGTQRARGQSSLRATSARATVAMAGRCGERCALRGLRAAGASRGPGRRGRAPSEGLQCDRQPTGAQGLFHSRGHGAGCAHCPLPPSGWVNSSLKGTGKESGGTCHVRRSWAGPADLSPGSNIILGEGALRSGPTSAATPRGARKLLSGPSSHGHCSRGHAMVQIHSRNFRKAEQPQEPPKPGPLSPSCRAS